MKKRILFAALMVVVMLAASCVIALADGDVPPPNQISDNLHFSAYEWHMNVMPIATKELAITREVASISKETSSSVYIRAVTETNKKCDIVGVVMSVEQWKNNKWNTYYTSTVSNFDSDEVSGSKVVAVDSGYYYRLYVKHRAILDPETKIEISTTNGILVN